MVSLTDSAAPVQRTDSPVLVRLRAILESLPKDEISAKAVERASALVEILSELGADEELILGAALFPLFASGSYDDSKAIEAFGPQPVRIAREIVKLGDFGIAGWRPNQ